MSNTKVAIKNLHNREFIQIETKPTSECNSEKIIDHHAKFFKGAFICQKSFLDQFSRIQRGNSNAQSRKMLTMMSNYSGGFRGGPAPSPFSTEINHQILVKLKI
jgi:hypothetical protein